MSDRYFLGPPPDHKLIRAGEGDEGLLNWARRFENMDRVIEQTGNRTVHVSTVFLGLDHNYWGGPPILFETMVFGGKHHEEMERYYTWDEAVRGHRRWVKRVFKHRPRRNGRAVNGDFSNQRRMAHERRKMDNVMKMARRLFPQLQADVDAAKAELNA